MLCVHFERTPYVGVGSAVRTAQKLSVVSASVVSEARLSGWPGRERTARRCPGEHQFRVSGPHSGPYILLES